MSPLEKKRTEAELMRVKAGRLELEFRIEEKKDDIKRMEESIVISEAKEAELEQKLKEMEK